MKLDCIARKENLLHHILQPAEAELYHFFYLAVLRKSKAAVTARVVEMGHIF